MVYSVFELLILWTEVSTVTIHWKAVEQNIVFHTQSGVKGLRMLGNWLHMICISGFSVKVIQLPNAILNVKELGGLC